MQNQDASGVYQNCLSKLIKEIDDPVTNNNESESLFLGSTDCWMLERRLSAIQKGLKYIYELSKISVMFNTFGNDIIQCFYDVSRVSPEPIRRLSLQYLDVVKRKWLSTLQSGYWKAKEQPNPQEVLDVAIILYSLQCLCSEVHFGEDLQKYVFSMSFDSNEQDKKMLLSVTDLFGWNPLTESIPTNIVDLCVKCHKRNPRRSTNCKFCGTDVAAITQYRALSNSLIYSFYCQMAGIELECCYEDYLKWLPSLRPYKSSNEITWPEFVDQCYLITHVVFTVSQWGQLCLQIHQLPHEYLFMQEHLPLLIQKQDVHLVGEFVQCLRIFGVDDNMSTLISGTHFLLQEQRDDGSWDNQTKDDLDADGAYIAYHATMVAIQALIPPVFAGYGCMNSTTESILADWYSCEFLRCMPITSPLSNVDDITTRTDFMKDPRLARIDDSLDAILDDIDVVAACIENRRVNER